MMRTQKRDITAIVARKVKTNAVTTAVKPPPLGLPLYDEVLIAMEMLIEKIQDIRGEGRFEEFKCQCDIWP